jgi:hypothetical protein
MFRRLLIPLVIVNAMLLACVAMVMVQAHAGAQIGPSVQRPRGQYLLLSGKLSGVPAHAIYVVDVNNQEMIALRWDGTNQRLEPFSYRNIAADAELGRRAR